MSAAVFWTAVASMVLLAVLLIVWPLLRRASAGGEVADDVRRAENVAAYRQQRLELEAAHGAGSLEAGAYAAALLELDRRLLADTATADGGAAGSGNGRALLLAAAIGVPLLALLLYRQFGAYSELELGAMISGLSAPMAAAERREQLARLVPLLEAQVRRRDPEGSYRFLLARIDAAEGRHAAAAELFRELAELYPDDADMAAQAAQTRFLAEEGHLTPAVRALAERALAIEPRHPGVQGMLGMAGFQAGDYAAAIEHWQILLEDLPADSPDAGLIRDGIAKARARLAAAAPPAEEHASP